MYNRFSMHKYTFSFFIDFPEDAVILKEENQQGGKFHEDHTVALCCVFYWFR